MIELHLFSGRESTGIRDRARSIVGLSVWAKDAQGVIDHEAWHEVVDRLPRLQRQIVEGSFKGERGQWPKLRALMEERKFSEALADPAHIGDWNERSAYGYQLYRQGAYNPSGMVRRVFDYISNIFERIRNAVRG